MKNWSYTIMVGFAALIAGAAATVAVSSNAPVSTMDKAAIERVVHDYILAHPEILPEAMERMRDREVGKAVAANRSIIETPFAGGWEGSATPDVTLVEFFDYACGYCRASIPVIDRLLKEDPKLRIVYREFPVLGPDSEAAAKASLAAAKAGKYGSFHRALFAEGRPEPHTVARVAKQLGIDPTQGNGPDATRELANNMELQRALNLTGTPSWIVGNKVLSGAVGYDVLKAAVTEARSLKR
ncbi:DsbA family protein [Sphingomonas sp.]|uniref:DsbA family protein n=1 Tax=Sphingomonas sp. TaxID=28214 RepID=UPI0025E0668F|nr:DsbA family protein [Sphingomonas sp.]